MRHRFSTCKMAPVLEVVKADLFVRLSIQRIKPALQLVYAFLVPARSFFKFFYAIFFSI